jgi:hypothetical protein
LRQESSVLQDKTQNESESELEGFIFVMTLQRQDLVHLEMKLKFDRF